MSLDYQRSPAGANVIAIGGDKLSRGLTLEGLSISYFTTHRESFEHADANGKMVRLQARIS